MTLNWIIFKYVVFLLPLFWFYMEKHFPTRIKIFELFSLFILIFFSTLRYGVGRDYFSYKLIYEHYIPAGVDYFATEPLAFYLFKFFNDIGVPYNLFLGILSAFYIIVFYIFVLRKLDGVYRILGYALFFLIDANYYASLGAIRQFIAVTIFILVVHFYNKDKLKSYGLLFIACLFHNTAILFFPLLLLRFKLSLRFFYIILSCLPILIFFPWVIEVVYSAVFSYLSIPLSLKYFTYSQPISVAKLLYYIFILIQIYFCLKLKRVNDNNNSDFGVYIDLVLVGLILNLLTFLGLNLFGRMLPYFYVFYPLVVYKLIEREICTLKMIIFFFLFIFVSFQVKGYLKPPEFANYRAQYRLLPFYEDAEIAVDNINYLNEERILNYTNTSE